MVGIIGLEKEKRMIVHIVNEAEALSLIYHASIFDLQVDTTCIQTCSLPNSSSFPDSSIAKKKHS